MITINYTHLTAKKGSDQDSNLGPSHPKGRYCRYTIGPPLP